MTTNADDDMADNPQEQPVQPQDSGVGSAARSPQDHFESKGDLVRAVYAAFYERYMLRVRYKWVAWPRYSPLWDGGVYRSRQYDSIWPEIAQFIDGLDLPYFEFVRNKFSLCSRTPPPPDALLSDIGADNLRQVMAERRHLYEIRLRSQSQLHKDVCTLLRVRAEEGKKVDPLIQNEDGRSDLFLYCLAVYYGVDHHIRGHRHMAIRQYLQCPSAYEQAWAVVMPTTMYEIALTEFGVELPEQKASSPPPDADQPREE